MEENVSMYNREEIILMLFAYRKKMERTLARGGVVSLDIEDAVSDAVEKFIKCLGGKIELGKCRNEYLSLFTIVSKNKLRDIFKKGGKNTIKKNEVITFQKDDPIDLRHRSQNRPQIKTESELVSDQDVFKDAMKKDTAHVAQTLVDSVLSASSEAANKVTRKYFELLVTKQEDVTQTELAEKCHVSGASISYTLRKVRSDVTKRHPELKETYIEFFAI